MPDRAPHAHPSPPLWLLLVLIVLAVLPFAFLGGLVGASDRAQTFLTVATAIFSTLAVLFWRALHVTFGPTAAQVGIAGIAFAAFIAMVVVSRMAGFPDDVFALPFLFPVWLAVLLALGSRLVRGRARRPAY